MEVAAAVMVFADRTLPLHLKGIAMAHKNKICTTTILYN